MADKDRQVRLENEKRASVDNFVWNNQYTPERRERKQKLFDFNAKKYYDHKRLDNDSDQVPLLIMVKDDYNVKTMIDHQLERIS